MPCFVFSQSAMADADLQEQCIARGATKVA